jgi:hypothetical protein
MPSENSIRALHCILSAFAHNDAELSTWAFARPNNKTAPSISFTNGKPGEVVEKNANRIENDCIKAVFQGAALYMNARIALKSLM